MAVQPIGSVPRPLAFDDDDGASGISQGGERFAAAITRVLREANQDQVSAARTIEDLVVEGKGSIHDAMLAMSNAEGSFRLLMEMRNRVVSAVNQLLQTRV